MTGAAAPSVELTVYGEAAASDANVVFPFDLALPAARDLWALAESVRTSKTDLTDRPGDRRVVEGSAPGRLRHQGDDLRLVGRERRCGPRSARRGHRRGVGGGPRSAEPDQQGPLGRAREAERRCPRLGDRRGVRRRGRLRPAAGQSVGPRVARLPRDRRPRAPAPRVGPLAPIWAASGPFVDLGGLRSAFRAFGRPDRGRRRGRRPAGPLN